MSSTPAARRPELGNRLDQARAADHGEEAERHEDVRHAVHGIGTAPRTGSRGTG